MKPHRMVLVAILALACSRPTYSQHPADLPTTDVQTADEGATRQITVVRAWPVGRGSAVVLRPNGPRPDANRRDLIVHFHGAVDAIREAMERDDGHETVLVVTMPGLSAAYAGPLRDNPRLFSDLLASAWAAEAGSNEPQDWRRITLSCFSAGYAAVREILRSQDADRIGAIVAADSIYAGLEHEGPPRMVDTGDMAGFLAFARRATAGERVFFLAHSSQPTPYASTTETADYLLDHLGLQRQTIPRDETVSFPMISRSGGGRLLVIGYAGESAEAHLHHLRTIDRHWQAARRLAAPP